MEPAPFLGNTLGTFLLSLAGVDDASWAHTAVSILSIPLALLADWLMFLWVLARLPRERQHPEPRVAELPRPGLVVLVERAGQLRGRVKRPALLKLPPPEPLAAEAPAEPEPNAEVTAREWQPTQPQVSAPEPNGDGDLAARVEAGSSTTRKRAWKATAIGRRVRLRHRRLRARRRA